jgi:hypothetical protein
MNIHIKMSALAVIPLVLVQAGAQVVHKDKIGQLAFRLVATSVPLQYRFNTGAL